MRARNLPWLVLGPLLLVPVSCAPQEQRATPSASRITKRPAPAPRRAPAPALSSAEYVARAGAVDLFVIESADMALQRSSSGSVRDFASMMIRAHKGTSSQLSFAGRRLNLLPARTLTPPYDMRLEQLRTAPSFDAAYKRQQLTVHQEALAIHSAYAARGRSPTLRPVASNAVPIMQRHLRLLRYL